MVECASMGVYRHLGVIPSGRQQDRRWKNQPLRAKLLGNESFDAIDHLFDCLIIVVRKLSMRCRTSNIEPRLN